MNSELLPIVRGIYRSRYPKENFVIQPNDVGEKRATLLSGIEIKVEGMQAEYIFDPMQVQVLRNGDIVREVIDEDSLLVRETLSPRSRLEFIARGESPIAHGFEKIIVES